MDQYEVLGQIGKGAFGAALLVRHKQEKKKYVLKKIRLARQTSRCRRSAHQEMNLISKMRNPFIVEYKESWVEKGCYVCIVIGYCEGGDMGEAIKNANGVLFPEEKLCKWLVQLLLALDYLHGNHILHRDVKCSNIFLTKDQNIRLGDFGLAKMLTSDDLASSVVGTPSYMCPELLADIPYGSKSDIWSLGCCMYEMASHKPAFKAFDMQALINKIIKSIITPLPSIYSSAFKGLIKSMLRKNPEHRPSASELLKHPLLRPFVIKICQKASTLSFLQPTRRSVSSYTENPEFEEPTHISLGIDTDEKQTSSQDNVDDATNPIAASSELNSPFSVRTQASSNCPNRCSSDASFSSNDMNSKDKRMTSRTPNVVATLRSAPAKILPVPSRRTDSTASKTVRGDSNFKTQPSSVTVANKNAISARRASLPFFSKTPRTLSETKASHILDQTISPYVSVNSPRIDKIAEFPMGSCESPLLFTLKKQTPSSLVRSSASFPPCPNHLTTMDKCTIEIHPKENPSSPLMHDGEDGIQSRYQNPTTKVPSRPRKLDTSSYKQRAEALEGLLEFSAKLLQQEKFEELGVLLKPFGPEKVSPRETAIWLAKSFKESTLKEEH